MVSHGNYSLQTHPFLCGSALLSILNALCPREASIPNAKTLISRQHDNRDLKVAKRKGETKISFSALDHSQPLFLSRPAHLNSLPKLSAPAHIFIYKEEPLFRHFWGYSTDCLNTFCKASKSRSSLFLPCCCPSWIYIGVQIEL